MGSDIEVVIKNLIHEKIRPQLKEHFGDIDFVSYKDNIVRIRFEGACKGCPSASTTLESVVKKTLQMEIDAIDDVIAVNEVSDDLMAMAKAILNKSKA
jgi:Fe-S cluster biogenesis protein NfuA